MLSDSESEGEDVQQLTINEHFAKAYARKKEREELGRCACPIRYIFNNLVLMWPVQ